MTIRNYTLLLLANFKFIVLPGQVDPAPAKKTGTSPLVLFSVSYTVPVNKNKVISSGHGMAADIGINPGKYLKKNMLLGLFAGYGFKDKCWSTSFNRDFVADYSSSFKDVQLSGLDSALVHSAGELFAQKKGSSPLSGCETRSFHNYSLYYGIVFRLPYKYFPVVKIYRGTKHTSYSTTAYITKNRDYNLYELRSAMQGIELVFFQGKKWAHQNKENENVRTFHLGALSFYYESCNFYHARLYFSDGVDRATVPFTAYLSDSFLAKYKNVSSFGFKLSLAII